MVKVIEATGNVKMMTIPLYNLGCGGGRASLAEHVLVKERGVLEAYANPATEAIYVRYDPAQTDRAVLVAVLEQLGVGPPDGAA
jgi:hypothetical protein